MSVGQEQIVSATTLGAALMTFAGWVPRILGAVASLVGIIWYAINISESEWYKSRFKRNKYLEDL